MRNYYVKPKISVKLFGGERISTDGALIPTPNPVMASGGSNQADAQNWIMTKFAENQSAVADIIKF